MVDPADAVVPIVVKKYHSVRQVWFCHHSHDPNQLLHVGRGPASSNAMPQWHPCPLCAQMTVSGFTLGMLPLWLQMLCWVLHATSLVAKVSLICVVCVTVPREEGPAIHFVVGCVGCGCRL